MIKTIALLFTLLLLVSNAAFASMVCQSKGSFVGNVVMAEEKAEDQGEEKSETPETNEEESEPDCS